MTSKERFWAKVEKTDGCWLWTGATVKGGYGQFAASNSASSTLAHRIAYEWLVGPIPTGLHIDHLCGVRNCVNPAHLEAVTQRENNRRARTWENGARYYRARTHCPRGHLYDEANTYVSKAGSRHCRACGREKYHERKARNGRV